MVTIATCLAVITIFLSCKKDDKEPNTSLTYDEGIVINGVKWATRNVDKPGTFAVTSENAGMFYQWNRKTAWPATDKISGWNSSTPTSSAWERDNDPSPSGWRIPTFTELQKLCDTDNVTFEWIDKDGFIGGKFTDKSTGNSLFLSAAGCRLADDGTLYDAGSYGYYWSSTAYDTDNDYILLFDNCCAGLYWCGSCRNEGKSIRSVAE